MMVIIELMNNKPQQRSELVTFLMYGFIKTGLTKQWVHSIAHLWPQLYHQFIWTEHATNSLCLRFWYMEISVLKCRETGATSSHMWSLETAGLCTSLDTVCLGIALEAHKQRNYNTVWAKILISWSITTYSCFPYPTVLF